MATLMPTASTVATAPPAADKDRLAPSRLAEIRILAPISVIVPTYREAENLPELLHRIDAVREAYDLDLEVLILDDNSQDGTDVVLRRLNYAWVKLIVRTTNRGLSPAVVDGLRLARNPVLVVMDADLSHPAERIPEMVLALESGQQFVIGSRYVPGGMTADNWSFLRWLNSHVATLMARPFCDAKDPMSGFFALRRSHFLEADHLNPVGYKIGLELIVKCHTKNIGEIPIFFADRKRGQSKLSFKEQLRYIQHLRRLFVYKFALWSSVLHFMAVGASGAVVNLGLLTLLLAAGVSREPAVAAGIGTSIVNNFLLNRRLTFGYARDRSILKQFVGFCLASSMGAAVNFSVTLGIVHFFPHVRLQAAAAVGILAGMFLNFTANRYLVFRVNAEGPGANRCGRS
jgi:dolichol-phosphate mannosyltransferase